MKMLILCLYIIFLTSESEAHERFSLKTGGRAWRTHNVNENYTVPDSPHDSGVDSSICEHMKDLRLGGPLVFHRHML